MSPIPTIKVSKNPSLKKVKPPDIQVYKMPKNI